MSRLTKSFDNEGVHCRGNHLPEVARQGNEAYTNWQTEALSVQALSRERLRQMHFSDIFYNLLWSLKIEKNIMPTHHIILADDHALIRQGLKMIIEEDTSLKVVGEVGDGLELLNRLKNTPADLVLLDISMPNLRGIEAIAEAKKICPAIKVLLLTMHKNEQYFSCAMAAGSDGYMLKEDSDTELISAIHSVLDGKTYISPFFRETLSEDTIKAYLSNRKLPREPLTTRERQVLKLVAEGETSRDIAQLLSISTRTVEHHRANLMKKLSIKKTADLIRYAISKGYVSSSYV